MFARAAFRLPLLLALLTTVSPVAGQTISALKEHDINRPISWSAERSEILGREDLALLIGNVRVAQGDLLLTSDRLHIFYVLDDAAANPDVQRLDATGNVVLESPSETANAAWGVYDIENRLITLGGGVRLERGGSTLSGERLEIDLRNGVAKIDGGPVEGDSGRVEGEFALPGDGDGGS